MIVCDGCHKQADESKGECQFWKKRSMPFLKPDVAKYYCDDCWILMIRATPVGGTQ